MKKGRRLVLDETNLRILEIVSAFPEGLYFQKLLDIFAGKKLSGKEKAKLRNILYGRVIRLAKYGYLITKKHQGMLWLHINPLASKDFKVKIKGKKCSSIPAKNRQHHEFLNNVFLAKLNSFTINGYKVFSGLKKEIKSGKRVITGKMGFLGQQKPFMTRSYGFNRSLSESRFKRDIELFEEFKEYMKIVISTSYIEKAALREMRRLGVKGILTLNYNHRNYGDPRRFRERWDFRRKLYPELPPNPPKIISKKEFVERVKKGKMRAMQKLEAWIYLTLRKISPLFRRFDDIRRSVRAILIQKLREGDIRGFRAAQFGLDLLNEGVTAGLDPP